MSLDIGNIVSATGRQVKAIESRIAELEGQDMNDPQSLLRLQMALGELSNLRSLQSNIVREIKDINQKIVQNA